MAAPTSLRGSRDAATRTMQAGSCNELLELVSAMLGVKLAEPTTGRGAEGLSGPPAQADAPTTGAEGVQIQVVAAQPGLGLHQFVGMSTAVAQGGGGSAVALDFARICLAPCNVRIAAGDHRHAVGMNGAFPLPIERETGGSLVLMVQGDEVDVQVSPLSF